MFILASIAGAPSPGIAEDWRANREGAVMTVLRDLRSIIPSPCYLRPFVCDGLPQSCEVMVVGQNPATEMDTDWWTYWSDESGFDLRRFEHDYEARRLTQRKRAMSNTRLRLKRLRNHSLRCLETNVFAQEGPNSGGPNIKLLRLFLAELPQLKAIIVHGKEANDQMDQIEIPARLHRWSTRHFRNVRYNEIDDIAAEIKAKP
jgi:hypothetical protein